MANKPAHHALITEAHSVKGLVEFIKEPSQYALIFILLMRLQDSSTESRCQCQCHKSRQGHGNSDGLGNLAVSAITSYDYPLIQGYVLWISLIYMLVNLAVDISYSYVDPRMREKR